MANAAGALDQRASEGDDPGFLGIRQRDDEDAALRGRHSVRLAAGGFRPVEGGAGACGGGQGIGDQRGRAG